MDDTWSQAEKTAVSHTLKYSLVGTPDTVLRGLEDFIQLTGVDEVMVTAQIYDHAARLRSFEIVSDLFSPSGEGAGSTARLPHK